MIRNTRHTSPLTRVAVFLISCVFFHSYADAAKKTSRSPRIPKQAIAQLESECNGGIAQSCHYLGLIDLKYGDKNAASALFKKACAGGYADGCEQQKKMGRSAISDVDYSNMRFLILPNGLRVTLLPSTQTGSVLFRFYVDSGHKSESEEEVGLAHLTEHCVFQDPKQIRKNYLDDYRFHDVDGNGYTRFIDTLYEGKLPTKQTGWMISQLATMMGPRKFNAPMIEKAKHEIDLELGPVRKWLEGYFSKSEWTFFQSEFGVQQKDWSNLKVLLKKRDLTEADVQRFFDRFYRPQNMRFFIVGNFDADKATADITESLGTFPSEGWQPEPASVVIPREKPYLESHLTTDAPRLTLGTKFWNLGPKDELILRAYFRDISDRLMTKIRSEKAQTYTVSPYVWVDSRKFGYGQVSFETSAANFEKNESYVRTLMHDEAVNGTMTNRAIDLMRESYAYHISGFSQDLDSLMEACEWAAYFRRTYGLNVNPDELFKSVTTNDVRNVLKKHFAPNHEIRIRHVSPLFSPLEGFFLWILCVAAPIVGIRRYFERRRSPEVTYAHSARVRYSFIAILALAVLAVSFFIGCSYLFQKLTEFEQNFVWPQVHARTTIYLQEAGMLLLKYSLLSLAMSLLPRKIQLADGTITIDYFFRRQCSFPVSTTRSIMEITPVQAIRRHGIRLTFGYFRLPFAKGLLLELNDGRTYYFSVKDPDKFAESVSANLAHE